MNKLSIHYFSSVIFGIVGLCSACKPASHKSSDPQHQFGNTVVRSEHFQKCEKVDPHPQLTQTYGYLASLKDHIARANPQTFSGMLVPQNMCIVLSAFNKGTGGGAFGDSGRIEIERMTVSQSANDAELAFIVCHEMAHVAMRHLRITQSGPKGESLNFSNGKGPEHYFRQLDQKAGYRELKNKLDQMNQRYAALGLENEKLNSEYQGVIKRAVPAEIINQAKASPEGARKALEWYQRCSTVDCLRLKELEQKKTSLEGERFELHRAQIPAQEYAIYKFISDSVPREVFITWAEREADEVGLEYCVRAGFEPRSLLNTRARRLRSSSAADSLDSLKKCRSAIDSALPKVQTSADPWGRVNEIPIAEGIVGDHPDECWRLFNLERELIIHAKDFRPFIKNLKNAIPGALDRAKLEIKAFESQ